ncbi:MAG TPA: hypothetical protein PLP17_03170 [Oligoflexia bacterium]|nr:hypothetical protein [Oligoflexia bacterium]
MVDSSFVTAGAAALGSLVGAAASIDALTRSMERPEQIVNLYGTLSCIRLVSGNDVVRQGEACCRRIIALYGEPNLTIDRLLAAVVATDVDRLDPLKEFSNACRNELLA